MRKLFLFIFATLATTILFGNAIQSTDNNLILLMPDSNPAQTIATSGSYRTTSYAITSPADGSSFNMGIPVTVQVTATDTDGSINRVDFYIDGAGAPLGTDSTDPYSFVWDTTTASGGSHTIEARAVDNENNMASSSVTINLVPATSEGFETGDFSAFPWVQSGNGPWTVQFGSAYSGLYTARSGVILDNQSSVMAVTLNITTAGNISFYQLISSELNYDFLRFNIDDVQMGQWSGVGSWTQQSYPVTVGIHTFTWTYSKDINTVGGVDAAFVDHIIFPAYSVVSFYPPRTLVGTSGNAYCNINWLAPLTGTPTSYNIYRNSSLLTSTTNLTFTDNAVVNNSTYTYYVTAVYNNTPADESSASNTVTLTPTSTTVVTIGTGTNVNPYPFGMNTGYSRDAALYLSTDIGTTGVIQSINWYVGTSRTVAAPVTIYLKTTTNSLMTSDTWANMINGATAVYSLASQSFTTTGWRTIILTTPFTYTSGNLLILIDTAYGASGTTSYPAFRYTTGVSGRHQNWTSNTTPPTGNGTIGVNRPNIQLTINSLPPVPVFSINPTNLGYGNVYVGTSSSQNFMVTNAGSGTLSGQITTPDGYSVAPTTGAARSISNIRNVITYSLTTGQSQTYNLTFSPTAIQSYNGNVTITSNDTGHLTNNLAVTGAGIAPVFNAPTGLTVGAGHTMVLLAWTAPTGGAGTLSGYKVFRNGSLITPTPITAVNYTDTGLTNGVQYTYYVTAVYTSPTGESNPSGTINATPVALPPQNLSGTPGNATATLTWVAPMLGTPSGYKVYRDNVYQLTVTGLTYTDTSVSNNITYSYYVMAAYANPVMESVASNTVTVTPSSSTLITIGTGTGTQRFPIGMYYDYERSAALYLSSEIGTTGTITSLGWYVGTGQVATAPVVIRMKTTTSTTLTTSTWANMITGATTVYTATISCPTAGWQTINLDSPFTFTTGNVLVLVETNIGAYTNNYPVFRFSAGATGRHLTWSQDSTAPTGNGAASSNRPNIQIRIGVATPTPVFSVTPSTLAYGNVYMGMSSTLPFTITNTGTATLSGNITTPTGYTVSSARETGSGLGSRNSNSLRNTLAYSIGAGLNQTFNLTFSPTGALDYSGNLAITSNDTGHANNVITLTGAGIPDVFNPPSGLTATAGNASVSLNWVSPSGGTGILNGYKIFRGGSLITPTPITLTSYNDTGLTNGVLYTYYVTAVYTLPEGESVASNTATATPSAVVEQVVQIGTGTVTAMSIPVEPYYGYTYSQSIMLQSDINVPGASITKVAWYYNGTTAWTDAIKIYMGHTALTSFAAFTDWVPLSQLTLVYDGTLVAPAVPGWIELTLNTTFAYNNISNLVIAVDENTPGYHNDADEFFCTTTATNRSITFYNDNINPDPAVPPTTGSYLYLRAAIPNTKLTFGSAPSTPIFAVSPASIDYGQVNINTIHENTVRISNAGGGTLNINTIALNSTVFSIVNPPVLPLSLTAGQFVEMNIRYIPTAVGTFSANLTITDDLTRTEHTVTISGSAVDVTVSIFPWTQPFDSWPPLNWSLAGGTQTWTSYNDGVLMCAMANLWGWVVPNNGVMVTPPLHPGQQMKLQFRWSHHYNASYPNDAMRVSYSTDQTSWTEIWYKEIADFESNDGALDTTPGTFVTEEIILPATLANQTFYIKYDAISGYGPNLYVDDVTVSPFASVPVMVVDPVSMDFGIIQAGTTSQQTLTIENTGSANLIGSVATPAGYSAVLSGRQSQRNSLDFDLTPGQSASYIITYAPLLAQVYAGNIVVTSNDVNNASLNVPVTGDAYIPPTITINPSTVNSYLVSGANETQNITLGNTGSQPLTYSIQINGGTTRSVQPPSSAGNSGRDITGSTVTVNPNVYQAGTTVNWTLSVFNGTLDGEWLKDVAVTFPAGVTVNSSTPFSGGSGGDLSSNGVTGNGATVVWHGENESGWGFIGDYETATAIVNVTVIESYTGAMTVPYVLSGDLYGNAPHVVNGSFALTEGVAPLTWFTASPLTGTIPAGQTQIITAQFDAFHINEGIYQASMTINSNDAAHPQSTVSIIMDVANGNHPPTINLPASFTFNKNSYLYVDFNAYTNDPDGDFLYLTMTGGTHIHANVNRRRVTFTADPHWFGSEVLTFSVYDDQYTASCNVTVNVLPTAPPTWVPVVYPNATATVNGVVTLDTVTLNAGDQVGAFVGDECRGIGIITEGRSALVTIAVNLANDGENVTFKVYSEVLDQVIQTQNTVVLHYGEVIGDPSRFPINLYSTPLAAIFKVNQTLRLQWNIVPGVIGYKIYWSDLQEGPYTLLTTTTNNWYNLPEISAHGFFKVASEFTTPTRK